MVAADNQNVADTQLRLVNTGVIQNALKEELAKLFLAIYVSFIKVSQFS